MKITGNQKLIIPNESRIGGGMWQSGGYSKDKNSCENG